MKKLLALVLALVMTLSLCTISNAAYSDAKDVDYDEAVAVMSAVGVFQGTDGKFDPKGILTREQAAKIVTYMLLGKTAADALVTIAAPFADVAADRWSAGSIAYCYNEGILAGVGNGMFAPASQLTGLAFAKMMLVALGYDAELEGLTGGNWSINAAKLALTVGLTDDMEDVALSAPMTREQAAKMAFNTMKSDMVKYGNNSTITVGDVVIKNNTEAAIITNHASVGATNTLNMDNVQFAEKYFPKLTRVDSTDGLGHVTDKWSFKGVKITNLASSTAAVTFTAKTKEAAVKEAMDGYAYKTAAVTVVYNGKDTTAVMSNAALAALTGNGTVVEVYVTDNEVSRVVLTQAYIADVTDVNTKNETITVKTRTTPAKTITAEEGFGDFAKKDVVMVVPKYNTAANAVTSIIDGTGEDLLSVVAATKVTGKITAVKTGKTLTMDKATTYDYAAVQGNTFSASVNSINDVDVYLDAYGYVVDCNAAAAPGNYLYLAKSWSAADTYDEYGAAGYACMAQVVKADGTIELVKVSKVDTLTAVKQDYSDSLGSPVTKAKATPGLYQYVVNDGKYELTSSTTYMDSTITANKIEKSTSNIDGYYFSDTMTVVSITGEAGTSKLKATVSTGKQTTQSTATFYVVTTKASGKTIETLFMVGEIAVPNTSLLYVQDASPVGSVTVDSKTYTCYNGYIDGKEVTFAYDTNSTASVSAKKFYNYTVNANEIYFLTVKEQVEDETITQLYNDQFVTTATLTGGVYDLSEAVIVDVQADGAPYEVESLGDISSYIDDGKTVKISCTYDADAKTVGYIYVTSVANLG